MSISQPESAFLREATFLKLLESSLLKWGKEMQSRATGRAATGPAYPAQGYGLTESTGGITSLIGPEETKRHGSAGKLAPNVEAKIIDTESGAAMLPSKQGELWLRGEPIMKGDCYIFLVLVKRLPNILRATVSPAAVAATSFDNLQSQLVATLSQMHAN
ncbi:4-coumarate--CoA ligase-like 6 [Nymphaea thermarum]|nr:4-coumarate--CoA ligase-like 6 [Nymphaea thermarum]